MGAHRSCVPLLLTALVMSMGALPAPNSVGSMIALKGPLRGFFAMRNRRSLSADVSLCLDDFIACDTTAGTAERCEIILLDISWSVENRGNDLRTAKAEMRGCIS